MPVGAARPCADPSSPSSSRSSPRWVSSRPRRAAAIGAAGRDHRRRDARRDGVVPLAGRQGLRGGDQVHVRTSSRSTAPTRRGRKVKAAVKGASIVVYFGHGNGWPSPYTYDPKYTTKDGFGLNATAGNGDSNNKYYGEPYVATLDLAPNAVVILEQPLLRVGQLRAGRRGARARPTPASASTTTAPGSSRRPRRSSPTGTAAPSPTSGRSSRPTPAIEEVWRTRPELPRPRVLVRLDPDQRRRRLHRHGHLDGGYYRSLVWRAGPDDRRGDRRGLRRHRASTPRRSSSPGTPRSRTPGATPIGSDGERRRRPSPPGPGLRLVEDASTRSAATGSAGRSGSRASTTRRSPGWVAAADLMPRDSKAPAVWAVDTAGGIVLAQWRRAVRRRLAQRPVLRDRRLARPDPRRRHRPQRADRPRHDLRGLTWDGLDDGAALPDGAVRLHHPGPGRVGQRADDEDGHADDRHGRPELASVSPERRRRTLVLAERRRYARHHRVDGHARSNAGRSSTRVYDADDQRVYTGAQSNSTGASTITLDRRRRRRPRRARRRHTRQGHAPRRDRHQRADRRAIGPRRHVARLTS